MVNNQREEWGTRVGYILAAMGMAIGTGNIWRFPRMVAENGGGSFLIGWAIFLFLWSFPLIMVEMVVGRKTRLGTTGSFRDFVGRKYTWMGGFITWVCIFITFYYSVVVGWTIKYASLAIGGAFHSGVDTNKLWETFTTNPAQTISFHFMAIVLSGIVVYFGVKRGIEAASKFLLPALFVLLIVAVIKSLSLDGAMAGLAYMFTPDPAYLVKADTWLQALSQSAWSTGAGWGLYATYAIYTRKKEDIAQNALTAGMGNNTVELLAGMAIIPAIFALAPSAEYMHQAMSSGNTGITFIYMAQLFGKMPGGYFMSVVFFIALAFAAISSLIAMVEFATRNFMDFGMDRHRAIVWVVAVCFLMGIPSAISMDIFNNQDWVWGIGLLFSCLFYAIAAIQYGVEKMRDEDVNPVSDIKLGNWFVFSIKYCIPVIFVFFLGWWLWQAVTWYPDNWWDPKEVFSVGTIVVQVVFAFAVVGILNGWFNKMIKRPYGSQMADSGKQNAKLGRGM
ncbi:neurotransmitter:Na+ symporter, NSS family [Desulfotomaculum arcticum]|uniref:Neurotransmitter:Na+ symporter, NSS family n=1 Tax=Desulfotruncus arcticus DSM 17038 TaxID=1121424 RepID=A0A1I2WN10_9FIRM|nr:sodium-dependent transporter [Desulfotruncus arcticus]SFH02674.1 neurotransmitter:Na+ symporter, NSS family [Desulfotomaculum arcticum] [Desulfotruncus arcticus DSM 17038]